MTTLDRARDFKQNDGALSPRTSTLATTLSARYKDVNNCIKTIKQTTENAKALISKANSAVSTSEVQQAKAGFDKNTHEGRVAAEKAKSWLLRLKREDEGAQSSPAESKMRTNMFQLHTRTLIKEVKAMQDAQNQLREALGIPDPISRVSMSEGTFHQPVPSSSAKNGASARSAQSAVAIEEDSKRNGGVGSRIVGQQQQSLDEDISEQVDATTDLVADRHVRIKKLQSDVNQIYDLFIDLQTLVTEQQDTFDTLETRLEEVKQTTIEANKELLEAEKQQKKCLVM